MVKLQNIRSLSEFQRNTKANLRRLKSTGQPEVLTINGKAEIVVQDAASYQKLLDSVDTVECIKTGIRQANRGEGQPMRNVLAEIGKRHGIRLSK